VDKVNDMSLHQEIKRCTICSDHLPLGPRPVVSWSSSSKIVIIGQAPGIKVHTSCIPLDDKSGNNLRDWMGINEEQFYNNSDIAIIPIGFCYPGTGKSGDLPPRPECASTWHRAVIQELINPDLFLLIGKYAQNYHLPEIKKFTLTETVKNYKNHLPKYFVLPHPSPRNNIWQARNPWFKKEVIPELKNTINSVLKLN
jgi:uracil-DNA glycosylase